MVLYFLSRMFWYVVEYFRMFYNTPKSFMGGPEFDNNKVNLQVQSFRLKIEDEFEVFLAKSVLDLSLTIIECNKHQPDQPKLGVAATKPPGTGGE